MCEVIEGTSAARLAEVMGLDASRYSRAALTAGAFRGDDDMGVVPRHQLPDEERFRGAEPFAVRCLRCALEAPFPGALAPVPVAPGTSAAAAEAAGLRSGLYCTRAGCNGLWGSREAEQPKRPLGNDEWGVAMPRLANSLVAFVRREANAYQAGWVVCEDNVCGMRTRAQSTHKAGYACTRVGCGSVMRPERGPAQLHLQLEALHAAFDVRRAIERRELLKLPCPSLPASALTETAALPLRHVEILDALMDEVQRYLAHSDYQYVQPAALFGYVGRMNASKGVDVKQLRFPGGAGGAAAPVSPQPFVSLRTAAGGAARAAGHASASGSSLAALGGKYAVSTGSGAAFAAAAPSAKARRVGGAGDDRGIMAMDEEGA